MTKNNFTAETEVVFNELFRIAQIVKDNSSDTDILKNEGEVFDYGDSFDFDSNDIEHCSKNAEFYIRIESSKECRLCGRIRLECHPYSTPEEEFYEIPLCFEELNNVEAMKNHFVELVNKMEKWETESAPKTIEMPRSIVYGREDDYIDPEFDDWMDNVTVDYPFVSFYEEK